MQKIAQGLSDFFGQFIKRYAPAIITLLILAGAFFFYSNVIIAENEQTLKERSFRGLNRIAGNIRQKIHNYGTQNSTNFLNEINRDSSTSRSNDLRKLHVQEEYGLKQINSDSTSADSIAKGLFSIKFNNEWQIIFNSPNSKNVKAAASVSGFVSPLLRRDLFDYYFVAYSDSVLFDELNLANYKFSAPKSGLTVTDSTTKGKLTQYGYINDVEVGGKRYKLFLSSFTAESNRLFLIGGYMPVDKYDEEKKYIPGNAILWLILGLVVVVLMFPLLKILLMNRSEQLLSRNVLTSLMSVHILGSIIIIILINIYAYFTLIRGRTDDHLKKLATSIQLTFRSELQDAVDEIDNSEKEAINVINKNKKRVAGGYLPDIYLRADAQANKERVYSITPDPAGSNDSTIPYKPGWLGNNYRYFENISWVDSSGKQVMRWTNNAFIPNKIDVHQRDYFQAVMNNSMLRSVNDKEYYLTAVSSWVSQKKLVVIARPSQLKQLLKTDTTLKGPIADSLGKIAMVSLSSPFRSIFNPILPYGFGFCIVDERGNVFFHYDEKRSLNENLLEECGAERHLSSLLNTGSSGKFNAHYTGTNHRFYAQPITGLPYYIVTFYDIENIWNQDLDVMSASSILVLLNMGVILFLVFITRMFSFRWLSKEILFIWIEPKSHRSNAYQKASAGFVTASVLLFLYTFLPGAPDDLYMLGITFGFTHILIGYSYYLYINSDKKEEERKRIAQMGERKDSNPADKKEWKEFLHPPLVILSIIYILAAVLFVWQLDSGEWDFLISQLLLLSILWMIVGWRNPVNKLKKQASVKYKLSPIDVEEDSYKPKYHRSLFTFILATGIVPTILFFSLSFKEEQRLAIKYQQVDFVNTFLQKKPFLYYDSVWQLSYRFPFHYNYFADTLDRNNKTDTPQKLATRFGAMYSAIKPSFSSYAKRIEYLNSDKEASGSFTWEATRSTDSLKLWFNVLKTNTIAEKNKRILATKKLQSGFALLFDEFKKYPVYHFIFIVAIILVLLGLALLVSFLIRHIFFFSKNNSMSLDALGEQFIKNVPDANHIYLIGIINSGKHRKIRESFSACKILNLDIAWLVAKGQNEKLVHSYDNELRAIADDLNAYMAGNAGDERRVVLIRHFELQMNDLEITEKKLLTLEALLGYRPFKDEKTNVERSVRIIISSSKHYDSMPLKGKMPDGSDRNFSDRWTNVMNNFCTFYHKWQEPVIKTARPGLLLQRTIVIKDYHFNDIMYKLNNECSHSEFLFGLRDPLKTFLLDERRKSSQSDLPWLPTREMSIRELNTMFESLCVKVQGIAQYYYLSLWQSLTDEEQRTLYDIASDGLMNLRNLDIAENLSALGLITIKENKTGYKLMNESFRLFVLTRLDRKEIQKLRNDADPGHSWNRLQLPVYLVVIGIAIFLFVTQKDAFNNLVTYLAAAAAGIAALLKALDALAAPKPATT